MGSGGSNLLLWSKNEVKKVVRNGTLNPYKSVYVYVWEIGSKRGQKGGQKGGSEKGVWTVKIEKKGQVPDRFWSVLVSFGQNRSKTMFCPVKSRKNRYFWVKLHGFGGKWIYWSRHYGYNMRYKQLRYLGGFWPKKGQKGVKKGSKWPKRAKMGDFWGSRNGPKGVSKSAYIFFIDLEQIVSDFFWGFSENSGSWKSWKKWKIVFFG